MKKEFIKPLFTVAISLLAFLFTSCESDEESTSFPTTLYAKELVKVSDVKMYTKNSEITDANKIKQFIDGSKFFKLTDALKESSAEIIFHSKDSASFDDSSIGFKVEKNNNQLLFFSDPYLIQQPPTGADEIFSQMLKHKIKLQPVSPSSGSYIKTEVRAAYGSYSDLELCVLLYKIISYRGLSYWRGEGKITNEFDSKVINTLSETDTIAVQEYRIRYKAK